MENIDFKDKAILITGATSGVGREMAIELSKHEALIGVVGRNSEKLIATAEKCKHRPLCLQADLTIDADVKCVARVFIEHYKKIDILINCAGIIERNSIEENDIMKFDRIMNTNIRAMFHLTMLLVPELIKSRGIILNVSSTNGLISEEYFMTYSMSKSAVDHFTRCVAVELGPKGVRCNAINPGAIPTEAYRSSGMDDLQYQKQLQHEKQSNCLRTLGEMKDIINLMLFLISDNASFITGCIVPVDGGRHVMSPIFK